jgi:hypothetical protein
MELSKALREASKLITGKQQLIVASVAKALEIVPRQLRCVLLRPLCTNCSTEVKQFLRLS